MSENDLLNLEKCELHCHVEGVFEPYWIWYNKDILKVDIGKTSFSELIDAYNITNSEQFFYNNKHSKTFYNVPNAIILLLKHHCLSLKKNNVVYSEIRINTNNLRFFKFEIYEYIRELTIEVSKYAEKLNIEVRFILGIRADKSLAVIEDDAVIAKKLFENKYIVGVDFNGNENNIDFKKIIPVCKYLHQNGLNITIHAGEFKNADNIWIAICECFCKRISHGVAIAHDESLISEIKRRNIHVEICVSSNIRTESVNDIEHHPIAKLYDSNCSISINTDDPGFFNTNMTNEYMLIHRAFGFSKEDFTNIFNMSIQSRFEYCNDFEMLMHNNSRNLSE